MMNGFILPLLAALLLFAAPALAQQPQPSQTPPAQSQEPPQASDEVRLIRALAMYRSGRLDLAFRAWETLAKEGNKEAAYVLRVLAPLRPIPE